MTTLVEFKLWGSTIGAISLESGADVAAFQFTPAFAKSGIEVSPIVMPLSDRVMMFPNLSHTPFHGLPGLLADSLPDKFGNELINKWLAAQGRTPGSFNAVERLCYTGARGMGALEFAPAAGTEFRQSIKVEIDLSVRMAMNRFWQKRSAATSREKFRRVSTSLQCRLRLLPVRWRSDYTHWSR